MSGQSKVLWAAAILAGVLLMSSPAEAGKRLGSSCGNNRECSSGWCDAGNGTSKSNTCVPAKGTGNGGDNCANNDQCRSGYCDGMKSRSGGAWYPGSCRKLKRLGSRCDNGRECSSGWCDAGIGTSKSNTCVPARGTGSSGDSCANNNHCRSGYCAGMKYRGGGAWYAGSCKSPQKLGAKCSNGGDCSSGWCDAGNDTSKSNTCVPAKGTGNRGDNCANHDQCRSGICAGMKPRSGGAWYAGSCSSPQKLGAVCNSGGECSSGWCDAGNDTSKSNTCVPAKGTGKTGDNCANNNQCSSGICSGMKPRSGGAWYAGSCNSGAIDVTGTVLDKRNRPVRNVTVRVWDVNPGVNTNVELGSTRTDSRGKFRVKARAYLDPGDLIGGGKQPDIRVTVETGALYSYPPSAGNNASSATSARRSTTEYFARSSKYLPAYYSQSKKNYWVGPTADSYVQKNIGKVVRLAVWPNNRDKQLANHEPGKSITIRRGEIRVPIKSWKKVRTGFDPTKHGFNFVNRTREVCWGPTCKAPWFELFRSSQALCGGMSLTALKHYINGRCDTHSRYKLSNRKDRRGKNRLPADLKQTLVKNQMETFFFNIYSDKDFNIGNGLEINTLKFLDWQAKRDEPNQQLGNTIGVSTKPEWTKIKAQLDRKMPVVIGQVKYQAAAHNMLDIAGSTNNHQVLAIGYDYNPYYGSVTLFVYDPNYPSKISEIRFNERLTHSKIFIDYNHSARTTHPIRGFFQMTMVPRDKRVPRSCAPLKIRVPPRPIRFRR